MIVLELLEQIYQIDYLFNEQLRCHFLLFRYMPLEHAPLPRFIQQISCNLFAFV